MPNISLEPERGQQTFFESVLFLPFFGFNARACSIRALARRSTLNKGSIAIWPEIGHNYHVAYRIVLTENAVEDFKALDARWRATVRDALRVHLTHEPMKQGKSRIKRLRDLRHPQFRLRVGDLRVFYDVTDTDVVILAIMPKEKTLQWLEEHGEK